MSAQARCTPTAIDARCQELLGLVGLEKKARQCRAI